MSILGNLEDEYRADSSCENTKISMEESCCKIVKTYMEESFRKVMKSI